MNSVVPGCVTGTMLALAVHGCIRIDVHEQASTSERVSGGAGAQALDAGTRMPDAQWVTGVRDAASGCGVLGFFDRVPLRDEDIACTAHDDCVRSEASCCPTCNADNIIALRKGAKRFHECCPALGCPHACQPYEPKRYARCVEGRCTIVAF